MGVEGILKLLQVYLLATVKYFLTFPYALIIGLDYSQALIVVTIGGITGFIFFFYLSDFIIKYYSAHKITIYCGIKQYFHIDLCRFFEKRKSFKKPFASKRHRKIIFLKRKYGFWGIIIMTPVLLSIPLGAFLLNKYYSRSRNIFAYMTISMIGWAVVFSTFFIIFPKQV